MEQFETKSIVNKDTLKELKPHLMRPRQKVLSILGLALSILCCFFADYWMLGVLFALFYACMLLFRAKIQVRLILKRIQESTGLQEYEITTSFGEESLKLFNHVTNGTTLMQYAHFKRLVETKNFYALFTKTQQIVLVNRREIDQAQKREAFLLFIDIHCVNIKRKKVYEP